MRSFTNLILAGLAFVMSACSVHTMPVPRDYNRLALVQPPQFDPRMLMEAEREPITTLAMSDRGFDNIEPAAGDAVEILEFYGPYPMLPAKPACKIGTNFAKGEAFAYNWGEGNLGLGFGGSSVRNSGIGGGAMLKLSFALDTPKKQKRKCDHAAAWKDFNDEVSTLSEQVFD